MHNITRFKIIRKMLPEVIFVLGCPGSGKGTLCKMIEARLGYTHLSAGELLREEVKREDSPHKELFEICTKMVKMMPVEVTVKLLETAMDQSEKKKFIIDGFPRNKDNLQGWNKEMAKKTKLLCVLSFNCPEDICVKRCMDRQRIDDGLDIFKKRYKSHFIDTVPIIEYYAKKNLVREIDGSKKPEPVFEEIKTVFQQIESPNANEN